MEKNKKIIYIIVALLIIGAALIGKGVIEFGDESKLVTFNGEVLTEDSSRIEFTLLNEGCTTHRCLFEGRENQNIIGFSQITGYHVEIESEYYNSVVICDAFVIVDGPEQYMVEEKKIFPINDGVAFIDADDLAAVRSSSEDNLINLDIVDQYTLLGKGAPECFSSIKIVDTDRHVE